MGRTRELLLVQAVSCGKVVLLSSLSFLLLFFFGGVCVKVVSNTEISHE